MKEPLRGTRYNTRDELMFYSAVNKEFEEDGRADGVRRLMSIWQKVINKGATILELNKCCTLVNKAMS